MLSALVSVEDANSLEGQANQIASRYETIAHRVRLTKDLLSEMALTVNDLFAVSPIVLDFCCPFDPYLVADYASVICFRMSTTSKCGSLTWSRRWTASVKLPSLLMT